MTETFVVFALVFLLGDKPQKLDMHFLSINTCNYYASRIVKRYGNYKTYAYVPKEHKATAYCKPINTYPGDPKVTRLYQ